MREVEYRVWSLEHKKMFKVESIHFPLGKISGKDITVTSLDDPEISEWLYDYVIMQSIGLKDKNDKKIFEGDIIENDIKRKYVIIWLEEVGCFVQSLIYSPIEGVFGYDTKVKKGNDFLDMRFNGKLVIGNIYENPELLEAK